MNNSDQSNDKATHSLYTKRGNFYTKIIKSRSHNQRLLVACFVYGLFILLPWISINNNPAIFFDLDARQFHIFWLTFWPQDFMFLAWALIIAAFSLFLFTTVAGRLWCGYVCPQSMWTFLFIWVEEKVEGSPSQRKKLDRQGASFNKFFIKLTKHCIWLLISFITAFSFVAYFYPAPQFIVDIIHFELPTAALVALFGFTYLTYIDAGWLREQVCVYMCPYAKFQSVMYDSDTLLVSYNGIKGEPRGSLKSPDRGQCIDCMECVHVCPTGIDIRDGVQIECINCALCLDVCNDVMKATNQPLDLISFTTLNTQQGLTDKNQIQTPAKTIVKNSLLRIKTIAYISVLCIFSTLFIYNLASRSPIEASVIPIREPIYRQLDSTTIANDYNIKIANKSGTVITLTITTSSSSFTIKNNNAITIDANDTYETDIRVISTNGDHGPMPYYFNITSNDKKYKSQLKTRFVFPPKRL